MHDVIILSLEIIGGVSLISGFVWSTAVFHTRAKVTQTKVEFIGKGVAKIGQNINDISISVLNLNNALEAHSVSCDKDREELNKRTESVEKRVRDAEERIRVLKAGD